MAEDSTDTILYILTEQFYLSIDFCRERKKKDAYVCYPYRATLTVLFITRDQHHPSIQLESIFRTLPRLSSNASEAPLSLELAYFEHRMSEVYVYPCTTEKADENLQPHKTKMTDEE